MGLWKLLGIGAKNPRRGAIEQAVVAGLRGLAKEKAGTSDLSIRLPCLSGTLMARIALHPWDFGG